MAKRKTKKKSRALSGSLAEHETRAQVNEVAASSHLRQFEASMARKDCREALVDILAAYGSVVRAEENRLAWGRPQHPPAVEEKVDRAALKFEKMCLR